MELLVFLLCAFAITQDVSAYPTKGNPYKSEHCIKMTPLKEQEINKIITRITDFLGNITTEFEDFDIRLIKLDIESHFEDEVEEKEVQLQLTVNDCTEYMDDDEDDAQKSEASVDTGEEQEKDILIEVTEKSNKEKPDEHHNEAASQVSVTSEQTTVESTTEDNDVKGCKNCPCVCNSGNRNVESAINKEDDIKNNVDTSKNTQNEPNAGKTGGDTNKNEIIACKKNTDTYDKTVKVNQANTKTGNHYDTTPVDVIRFYDFGEDTNSYNNKGGDRQPEITKIYTFSQEVKPEVITLDLSGVEGDVMNLIEKKNHKPLVVYIQRHANQNEYIFL